MNNTNDKTLMDKKIFLTPRTTIASYPGGKSDRKKHIPLFLSVPKKIPYLVEPFAGLANFFLVISPRVKQAWLNDKDPEIYSLLRCMKESDLLLELIEYIKSIEPVERDDYYQWKRLKPSQLLKRAIRRLVILNCSPNGAGGGYSKEKAHRKWYSNKPKVWNDIHNIFQKKKVRITDIDYMEVIRSIQKPNRQRDYFIYLDPPYFDVAQRGNLYGREYNLIDWKELKNALSQLHYHWILSNRDAPEMFQLFSNYHKLQYNTYNDMNNTRNKNPELLVSNKLLRFEKIEKKTLDTWF